MGEKKRKLAMMSSDTDPSEAKEKNPRNMF
jgi:hypothetical protein